MVSHPCRPLLLDDLDDLRNDVAGALHDDGVADAHILARDLVLVVQGRALHDDAADGDGLQPRDRRQRAGASDLNLDAVEERGRAFGRELVGNRPTWRAGRITETGLKREIVDFVNDAIDVVAERRALRFNRVIMRDEFVRIGAQA